MRFSVLTYNILADAYLRPERYAEVPKELLEPERRRGAILAELLASEADILCLQEVEPRVFEHFEDELISRGYDGAYAQKGRDRPDGCATFVRRERFSVLRTEVLRYEDGANKGRSSGHIALALELDSPFGPVGIANTHLRWNTPGTAQQDRWATAELRELVQHTAKTSLKNWILCGDFNFMPDDALMAFLRGTGFHHAHAGLEHQHTCCAKGKTALLDYLFCSAGLTAEPAAPASLKGVKSLPSREHPSDHLPLKSGFRMSV